MLKNFRKDISSQSIIILIVSLTMWMGAFIHPEPIPMAGGGPIYYWITSHLPLRVLAIIAYLLVLMQGVLLNSILYRHKMIGQNTLLPVLFYVLAMSLSTRTLTPLVLGNTLLILAISQMMLTTTYLSLTIDKTFGAAALMSIATIFCPAMAVFFVPLIFNMFNYSLYSWRDWTMLLLGIMAPYILLETYYYMTDEMFYRNYLLLYNMTDINFILDNSVVNWLISIVFLVIIVMGMGMVYMNSQSSTVNYQKNATTILVFLMGGLLYSLYATLIPIDTASFAAPFACCATAIFAEPRRKETGANIMFMAILLAGMAYCVVQ